MGMIEKAKKSEKKRGKAKKCKAAKLFRRKVLRYVYSLLPSGDTKRSEEPQSARCPNYGKGVFSRFS